MNRMATTRAQVTRGLFMTAALLLISHTALARQSAAPRPPSNVQATDHRWDTGNQVDLTWTLSPDDASVRGYRISTAVATIGGQSLTPTFVFADLVTRGKSKATLGDLPGHMDHWDVRKHFGDRIDVEALKSSGENEFDIGYLFQVVAVNPDGALSEPAQTATPLVPSMEFFDGGRLWLAIITFVLCGSIVSFILAARSGAKFYVRKIAGLEAVDEAVGRATEMGRPVLFVAGTQDMNDMQTIAGLTVLSRVAKTAAEYDAKVEVPTSRSLVMTAARETVHASFLSAGRPDSYNQDLIYYVTDEQFGFVAYLKGMMVREKPAACFSLGHFFAESLILAETGNSIGAIQVAGTAAPAQLPFFVAACDYTLIGEEFFAASAYLSGEPDQLGSLKGQDVGKIIVAAFLLVGCFLATAAVLTSSASMQDIVDFIRGTMLT
jgi:hypothetical protein